MIQETYRKAEFQSVIHAKPTKPITACIFLTLSLITLAGCAKNAPSSSPPAKAPDIAAGKQVFNSTCILCHTVNGTGGNTGPDLSHIAGNPEHNQQWIAEYIKDPKSKDSGSSMPPLKGKLSDQQIQDAAAYTASLK